MNEIALDSSALRAVSYDGEKQLLWIHFRRGDRYLYEAVPESVYYALLHAPSQGQYFNSAVRGHFRFQCLS